MATDKTNLQIVITKDLEKKIKKAATKLGFNNVPEMVRSMLVSVTNGPTNIAPFEYISANREEIYDREILDSKKAYKLGKAKTYNNVDKMIKDIELDR